MKMTLEATTERLDFKATDPKDLPTLHAWEQEARAEGLTLGYDSVESHRQALRNPDEAHVSLFAREGGRLVGFAILSGVKGENCSLELRRIVVRERGKGYGREAIRYFKDYCFRDRGFHRLWLNILANNSRARFLYQLEGFREEGVLRDCLLTEQGFRSLVVMSILEEEYRPAG